MFLSAALLTAQVILLWPNGAPGSAGKTGEESVVVTDNESRVATIHHPSITVYLPPKEMATGAAVIIAPGGGHQYLAITHEGYNVGEFLAKRGVAGFVLKYRLAREKESTYTIEGDALNDTKRAIRYVRSHAQELGINPNRIGIMGFSAGGQLAQLAALRFDAGEANATDPIDRVSSKPNFQALIYPGLSQPSPQDIPLSKDTPPAFLACGENDRQNISQGLSELYLAFKKAGASAELHVFAATGHGFGLRERDAARAHGQWAQRFVDWMKTQKLLGAETPAASR